MDAIFAFGICVFVAYIIVDYQTNRKTLKKLEKEMETLKDEIEKIQEKLR